MCAMSAAHPHLYLDPQKSEYSFPPEVVEIDLRGRADVSSGQFAYIDIGVHSPATSSRPCDGVVEGLATSVLCLYLGVLHYQDAWCTPHTAKCGTSNLNWMLLIENHQ